LDVKQNYKPRSTAIIRNFMEECGLEDVGWRDEDAYKEAPTSPQKPQQTGLHSSQYRAK
jgi:hypothetical protein